MPARFDSDAVAAAERDLVIGIRAGRKPHRSTAVWAVVVDGRVFIRSWGRRADGWYGTLVKEPVGVAQIGGREFPVRAVRTRSDRLGTAVDEAYRRKYHTPASAPYVDDMTSPEARETTIELVPVDAVGSDERVERPATSARTHPHTDMPSDDELGRLMEGRPPLIRQMYLDAHRLVLESVPEVRYSVDRVDCEIGYGARQFGYDGWGMAAVTPYAKWVSLTFVRGARLDDPDGLLEGASALMRHVKLRSTEELDAKRERVRRLLEAAARLNRG